MDPDKEFKEALRQRFLQLPRVVQEAIVSADISKHLQELANTHKLHLDQWETLENEVQYTLLGIQQPQDLAENIRKSVGVSVEIAEMLAASISKIVFEPIRQELERQLEHPDAIAEVTSKVDDVRAQVLASGENAFVAGVQAAGAPVVPATPPPAAPTAKVERAPVVAPSYKPGAASHERKDIVGDPYREQTI